MYKINTNARTVMVKNLVEDKRIVDGKEVIVKSILFKVASHRKYSVPKKDEAGNIVKDAQGNIVKERPSDFILCKAYGDKAEYIAHYCSGKHVVNGVEKVVSRFMELSGHLETYKSNRQVPVNQNMEIPTGSGNWYNIVLTTTVEVENTILIIDEIGEFLDPKPEGQAVTPKAVTPTATTVTPVSAPAPGTSAVAPQTPPAQPPVQPVVQQTPVTPVQQTPVTPVQQVGPVVGQQNIQTIDYTQMDITPPAGDFTDPPF